MPGPRRFPTKKVFGWTVSESDEDLTAALAAGVDGYVLKGVAAKALGEILESIRDGATYVPPKLAARLLVSLRKLNSRDGEHDPLAQLSKRELEVLGLVAGGLSNKEIGARLSLEEKTVKYHMTHILSKLRVRNRTEAAILMREAGASRG